MSEQYGVTPEGFVRKPLAVLLMERENRNVTIFGPGIIQTSESFFGQINGILADFEAQLWEIAEDVYQSSDPDQAEARNLERLARLRLLARRPGESDEDLRQAITNANRVTVRDDDFYRDLVSLSGVTYARIVVNDTVAIDRYKIPQNTVAIVVTGGNDDAIAEIVRRYVVPGIQTFGNYEISSVLDGYCRTIYITRPVTVPARIVLRVTKHRDQENCITPSNDTIASIIAQNYTFANGDVPTRHSLQALLFKYYENVEITNVTVQRKQNGEGATSILFSEILFVERADIEVIENV